MLKNKVELLAPAGSFDSLKGAVHAGADAVYMGGALFSARAYADNPNAADLAGCIEYCHFYGRKLYLAVNTLLKPGEIGERLTDFLTPAYEAGVDGVIVQDLGVMSVINESFPGLPIHVSTQAAVTMAQGAEWLKKKFPSITRIVPARELSIQELKRMRADTDLEIEVFVHGALCVCYSGMCLMSSYIGDRSGNRGRCAQPCRKLYAYDRGEPKYFLSPKDQCLLENIPELIEAGMNSFKIEGRMKSPEYTAGTVAVYRRAIDECTGTDNVGYMWKPGTGHTGDLEILRELYNRGGFNKGYLHTYNGLGMMSIERPNHSGVPVGKVVKVKGREASIALERDVYDHDVLEIRRGNTKIFEYTTGSPVKAGNIVKCLTMKDKTAVAGDEVYRTRCEALLSDIRERYLDERPRLPVNILFRAHKGEDCELTMTHVLSGHAVQEPADIKQNSNVTVTVRGNTVQKAQNAPVTAPVIRERLAKLGETAFEADEIICDTDDDIFVPVGELNRLRREAADALEREIIRRNSPGRFQNAEVRSKVPQHEGCGYTAGGFRVSASVWNEEQLDVLIDASVDEIIFNIDRIEAGEVINILNKHKVTIGLPYVCRAATYDRLKAMLSEIKEKYDGIRCIARNFEELSLLEELGTEYMTDYVPYSMNPEAARVLRGCRTISTELAENEIIADDRDTFIVYGYLPSMITTQCVYKNVTGRCRKNGAKEHSNSCGSDGYTELVSEGNTFKTRQLCDMCTNIIYNAACLDLTDRLDRIERLGVRNIRLDFTFETASQMRDVLNRLNRDEHAAACGTGERGLTHGHFNRPVL